MTEKTTTEKLSLYEVLSEINYAARRYNTGEEVYMPESRAKKFLDDKSIQLKPAAAKQSIA